MQDVDEYDGNADDEEDMQREVLEDIDDQELGVYPEQDDTVRGLLSWTRNYAQFLSTDARSDRGRCAA